MKLQFPSCHRTHVDAIIHKTLGTQNYWLKQLNSYLYTKIPCWISHRSCLTACLSWLVRYHPCISLRLNTGTTRSIPLGSRPSPMTNTIALGWICNEDNWQLIPWFCPENGEFSVICCEMCLKHWASRPLLWGWLYSVCVIGCYHVYMFFLKKKNMCYQILSWFTMLHVLAKHCSMLLTVLREGFLIKWWTQIKNMFIWAPCSSQNAQETTFDESVPGWLNHSGQRLRAHAVFFAGGHTWTLSN